MDKIAERASFDAIRYASVWEDADILCRALEPVAEGGRLLSIASSGDNALALLTLNPREVVAVDLSPAQLACVALRLVAITHLDDDALLAFLGVLPAEDRQATYDQLRSALDEKSRCFWDAHPHLIRAGMIHGGKFESYLRTFGLKVLPWIHSKSKRQSLIARKTLREQKQFYDSQWNTWLWRGLFRLFFSRFVMGRKGRDPAFFDQVQGTVADRILKRTEYALTELPTHTNPYLTYIMTGNYRLDALPYYLRPENLRVIRERLDRITLHLGPMESVSGDRFDGFNLSDAFEYLKGGELDECYTNLLRQANAGARLAYWNLLVPRTAPPCCREQVRALQDEANRLHSQDKAWFYQRFRIEEVI